MKKILLSAVTAVATIIVCIGLFIQPAQADTTNSVVTYMGNPGGTYVWLDNTYTNGFGISNGVPFSVNGGAFTFGYTTNQIQIVTGSGGGTTNKLAFKNGILTSITVGP